MELRGRLLGLVRVLSSNKLSKLVAISAASAGILFVVVSIGLNHVDFGVQRAGGVVALAFAGPTRHMKRLAAPKHRSLGKPVKRRGKKIGTFVTRPLSSGHKRNAVVPLNEILITGLKYAFNAHESRIIAKQREIKVDQRVRTDIRWPLGFMDVLSFDKTDTHFRLLWDRTHHLRLHKIIKEEAAYKLCQVKKFFEWKTMRLCVTHDGRSFPCPDDVIQARDTLVYEIMAKKVLDVLKFAVGNIMMVLSGKFGGQIGVIVEIIKRYNRKHEDVVFKDAYGNLQTVLADKVFVIGKGTQPWISLPKSEKQEMKEAHIYE